MFQMSEITLVTFHKIIMGKREKQQRISNQGKPAWYTLSGKPKFMGILAAVLPKLIVLIS